MSLARIEFSPEDEGVLKSLGGWMTFVAVVHFLAGGIGILFGCFGILGSFAAIAVFGVQGVLSLLSTLLLVLLCGALVAQGVFLVQVRGSVNAIATTDTADQTHLEAAFAKLKTFFLVDVVVGGLFLLRALSDLGQSALAAIQGGMS